MSLITGIYCRDGIVMGCDTRTTIKLNGDVRYSDTTMKVVPFPNRCCVAFCGNDRIKNGDTVHKILSEFRDDKAQCLTISKLPLALLNYFTAYSHDDITLLVGGFEYRSLGGYLYRINIKQSTIIALFSGREYGAGYDGMTNIAHAIFNSNIDYKNMSLDEAIKLSQLSINTTIAASEFWQAQTVGGKCKIYAISAYELNNCGWFSNGRFKKALNADVDALDKLQKTELCKQIESI